MSTQTLTRDLEGLTQELTRVQLEKAREQTIQDAIAAKKRAIIAATKKENRKAAEPVFKREMAQLRKVVKLTQELDTALQELDSIGDELQRLGQYRTNSLAKELRYGVNAGLSFWRNWHPELLGLKPRKKK